MPTAGDHRNDRGRWTWKRALEETGVLANRAVHIGNRIDKDIRPAKQAGLHTIWLLRGEAPPSPTVEQLAEADAIVTTSSGVPHALGRHLAIAHFCDDGVTDTITTAPGIAAQS
jgi:ribonucleotide monophosphatase NagD (HAD superfamily)